MSSFFFGSAKLCLPVNFGQNQAKFPLVRLMEVNWKRDTKSTKERFIDDFLFDVNGTKIKIHQKPIDFSKVEGEHDLGAVGRTVWDAVSFFAETNLQITEYRFE